MSSRRLLLTIVVTGALLRRLHSPSAYFVTRYPLMSSVATVPGSIPAAANAKCGRLASGRYLQILFRSQRQFDQPFHDGPRRFVWKVDQHDFFRVQFADVAAVFGQGRTAGSKVAMR